MSGLFFATRNEIRPLLAIGELDQASGIARAKLAALAPSPFHRALESQFLNDARDAALFFDELLWGVGQVLRRSSNARLCAAYSEIDDLTAHRSRLTCGFLGYTRDGGDADFDWLSRPQFRCPRSYRLRGCEQLQRVYAGAHLQNREFEDAMYMASMVIALQFMQFLCRAAREMSALECPLYVSAHEMELCYVIRPLDVKFAHNDSVKSDPQGRRPFIARFPANCYLGKLLGFFPNAQGGSLYVTATALIFRPHRFNFGSTLPRAITIADIREIRRGFANLLHVRLQDGTRYAFHVDRRMQLIDLLRQCGGQFEAR